MEARRPQEARPPILVVGCGGVGGSVAGALAQAGQDVTAVTHNEAIAAAIGRDGLMLAAGRYARNVRFPAFAALPDAAFGRRFPYILLATPPTALAQAAKDALPYLADGGALVCLPNGLPEEIVAAVAGAERVIGCVVTFGASMIAPGQVRRTSRGRLTLGRPGGGSDARLHELAGIMSAVAPVSLTRNIPGVRWSKLAISCAISTLGTIGGDRAGPLMLHTFTRRLALEAMTEALTVARAEGITMEKVRGTVDLPWLAITDARGRPRSRAALIARHAVMLAIGLKYRNIRSSMLAAIERGREPPIDFLNGEVCRRAAPHGITTPVNAHAVVLLKRMAKGELRPSLAALQELYDCTRAGTSAPPRTPRRGGA